MDVERAIEFLLDKQAKTDAELTGLYELLQNGINQLMEHYDTISRKLDALLEGQNQIHARLDRVLDSNIRDQ